MGKGYKFYPRLIPGIKPSPHRVVSATNQVLSVQRIRNKNYHIDLAREDYYQTGGEAPGLWHGRGAELLGLKAGEKVSRDNLHNLMDGLSPEGSQKLVQNAGAGKVVYRNRRGVLREREREIGWDFTLSAPKSLSIIWSQADLRTRKAVEKIHADAVKKTLDWLELQATTRRGKGGTKRESSKLAIAMFPHGTSRAVDNHLPDPQLHTHCLVMNLGVRDDGTTGAIEINRLLEHKMIVGALYRAELAKQIGERLGYEIGAHIQEKGEDEVDLSVKKQGNLFEVKGVKEELVLEFSKRRRKIKQQLQDRGEESSVAAEVAALDTREQKGEVPPRDELFEMWQRIGREFGYEPPVPKFPQRDAEKMRQEACNRALDNVLKKQGMFSQKDLLRSISEIAPFYGLGIEEVKLAVKERLAQDNIVSLGYINGKSCYSTKEIIPVQKGRVAAVEASKLLEAKELESQGYKLLGVAPGRKALALQKDTGIKSYTLHRFLYKLRDGHLALDNKTLVVLAESGVIPRQILSELMEQIEQGGARLLLIGTGGRLRQLGEVVQDVQRGSQAEVETTPHASVSRHKGKTNNLLER